MKSIWHQIQHLRLTLDRIFGPDVNNILPGARWATRGPKIKNMFEILDVDLGSKKWVRNPNPGFFLEMSGMALGSVLAYWGIIWGP